MENQTKPQNKIPTLSILCYILSGLLAVTAVVLAISIVPLSQSVMNFNIFFQLTGLDALTNALLRPLQGVIINGGIVIAIVTLLLAFIIFMAGRIFGQQANLQDRIRLLEEKTQ